MFRFLRLRISIVAGMATPQRARPESTPHSAALRSSPVRGRVEYPLMKVKADSPFPFRVMLRTARRALPFCVTSYLTV